MFCVIGIATDFQCEPDEYALLVADLKKSGIIKDHKKLFSTVKNSFTGKAFVSWVMKEKGLGKYLIFKDLIVHVLTWQPS